MFVSLSVAMLPKLRTSSTDSSYSTTQHNTVINLMASVLRKVALGTPFGEGAEESAGLDHLEIGVHWHCLSIFESCMCFWLCRQCSQQGMEPTQ